MSGAIVVTPRFSAQRVMRRRLASAECTPRTPAATTPPPARAAARTSPKVPPSHARSGGDPFSMKSRSGSMSPAAKFRTAPPFRRCAKARRSTSARSATRSGTNKRCRDTRGNARKNDRSAAITSRSYLSHAVISASAS